MSALPPLTLVQYGGFAGGLTLSPPCAKVHMALRFKGLAYETLDVFSPAQVRRHNPRGLVPVLLAGQEQVVDSTDILAWIEGRCPEPSLVPSSDTERALAKLLEDWADEVLYGYGLWLRWIDGENYGRLRSEVLSRAPFPLNLIVPPLARRAVRRRAEGRGIAQKGGEVVRRELAECYDALATFFLTSPFLAGERLSHADLAVASVLDQLRLERLTPLEARELERRPALVAWLERVHALAPDAARAISPG